MYEKSKMKEREKARETSKMEKRVRGNKKAKWMAG